MTNPRAAAGVPLMFHALSNKWILLAAVLCVVSGCVSSEHPPKTPRVKVDAETWADGSNKDVVRKMKRRRQDYVNRVLEKRRDVELQPPTEDPRGISRTQNIESGSSRSSAFQAQQDLSAPPVSEGGYTSGRSWSGDETLGIHSLATEKAAVPAAKDRAGHLGRPAAQASFHSEPMHQRAVSAPSSPAAKDRQRSEPLQTLPNTRPSETSGAKQPSDEIEADDRETSASGKGVEQLSSQPTRQAVTTQQGTAAFANSESAPELRVKGIILGANRNRVALLEIGGAETVLARAGDRIEVTSQGTRTMAHIVSITENSVRVRFGNQEEVKVLR